MCSASISTRSRLSGCRDACILCPQPEFFGIRGHLGECRTAFRDYILTKRQQIGEWYSTM
jgi:hypothetical protein